MRFIFVNNKECIDVFHISGFSTFRGVFFFRSAKKTKNPINFDEHFMYLVVSPSANNCSDEVYLFRHPKKKKEKRRELSLRIDKRKPAATRVKAVSGVFVVFGLIAYCESSSETGDSIPRKRTFNEVEGKRKIQLK